MLALVSRVAPVQVKSTLMGGTFLALFAGSLLMGWVGSYYVYKLVFDRTVGVCE